MLYKFLRSKKGFTLVELLIVVAILGILTAIAIPAFSDGLKKQRQNDCRNQCLTIETAVQQAMYGMIDNGKRQETISFMYGGMECHDGMTENDEKFFKLTADENCFTLAELRGGYRPVSEEDDPINGKDYNAGCKDGYYLKKRAFDEKQGGASAPRYFYIELSNQEVPICPFEEYNESGTPYFYYVLADGTVHCSSPECE